jgi:hypothetical protein
MRVMGTTPHACFISSRCSALMRSCDEVQVRYLVIILLPIAKDIEFSCSAALRSQALTYAAFQHDRHGRGLLEEEATNGSGQKASRPGCGPTAR